ncbi:MAG: bestrophin-like domain, partial [Flavitalea sp.]
AGMFIIPLAAVLIPVFIGQRYGNYYSKLRPDIKHVPIESVVSAAFGLLAFMLGFTFQIAASRFETRKELLIEEVKDIRTAYLRAGLIPEPYRSNTKKHLVEYVDIRVDLLNDMSKVDYAIARSQVILDSLWKYTEALAVQDRSSEVYALYTTAINDLFDAYNERITMVFVYRVPKSVMWVLFIMVVLSMLALGYQFGITGKGSSWIVVLLGVIFAVVMFLISALDQAETGLVKLNQKPLLSLKEQLQKNQLNVQPSVP